MSKRKEISMHYGDTFERITPFGRLERWQLDTGTVIEDITSPADVESILVSIKNAMVAGQSQFLYGIKDHTKLHRSSMSQGIFEGVKKILRRGESSDFLGASAIILNSEGHRRNLTANDTRNNFTLHDIVSLGIAIEQAIQFLNEDSITVTTYSEYVLYIASITNKGTNKTTHSIAIFENHHNLREVMQAVKASRPTIRTFTQAELDELKWKRAKDRETRVERLRKARNMRYITFPPDWEEKEKALDKRNQYRIDHPAIGGLPSLGKKSK